MLIEVICALKVCGFLVLIGDVVGQFLLSSQSDYTIATFKSCFHFCEWLRLSGLDKF